jgi:sodium-dependent dicarboxylate transporter 2/3/5
MSRGERTVLAVVSVAVFLWLFKNYVEQWIPWIDLNDTSIGLLAAVALFVIPVNLRKGVFALSGEWALKLPWGVIMMFGGGLSLARTIKSSGLSDWIGASASIMTVLPTVAVVLIVVILIIFLTELTSNTATTATFLPIVAAVAVGMGENPFLLVFPTVLAASCAFMMPVATPPNAVVFASGHITIPQMVRGGFLVNLIGIVVATVMAYTLVLLVFGIEPGVLPEWAQSG